MTALVQVPDRDRLEVVLIERAGLGWAVGIGRLMARGIERDRTAFLMEREAIGAARRLADAGDMLLLRVEAGEGACD
ncbi:MAG: hypothetical protein DI530_12215 [Sphingomonas sp.]|uniref:hypothetical protein n=1 Tax=Sphingomonas sp. TaxID=28214 RepID=UPI000DBC0860|nr:hypothetical protein [Sphingomonas sp.]PZU77749.1 MAG: hypothetical protein DI530_12215 [Sphingomonas sp.]